MKKTEQENEELREKLKTLEESSVNENWLKFGYSYKLYSPWGPVQSTDGPCWFELGYLKFLVISNSKPFTLNFPSVILSISNCFSSPRSVTNSGGTIFWLELNWLLLDQSMFYLLSECWRAGKGEWLSKTTSGDAGSWTWGKPRKALSWHCNEVSCTLC